mgnify:CR=1 FL=1
MTRLNEFGLTCFDELDEFGHYVGNVVDEFGHRLLITIAEELLLDMITARSEDIKTVVLSRYDGARLGVDVDCLSTMTVHVQGQAFVQIERTVAYIEEAILTTRFGQRLEVNTRMMLLLQGWDIAGRLQKFASYDAVGTVDERRLNMMLMAGNWLQGLSKVGVSVDATIVEWSYSVDVAGRGWMFKVGDVIELRDVITDRVRVWIADAVCGKFEEAYTVMVNVGDKSGVIADLEMFTEVGIADSLVMVSLRQALGSVTAECVARSLMEISRKVFAGVWDGTVSCDGVSWEVRSIQVGRYDLIDVLGSWVDGGAILRRIYAYLMAKSMTDGEIMDATFHIKRGDSGPALECCIVDQDGNVKHYPIEKVEFSLMDLSGEELMRKQGVWDGERLKVAWTSTETLALEPGVYHGEFECELEDGEKITVPNEGYIRVRVVG